MPACQRSRLPDCDPQAEIFNQEDCPPLARYTIDSRYTEAVAGVNLSNEIGNENEFVGD